MPIFEKSTIAERRRKTQSSLLPHLKSGDMVLFICGEPVQKPGGLDQTYDFLPHPEYYWLTGSRRAGGILAFTPEEGWIDFVIPVTAVEKLWEGTIEEVEGRDVSGFEDWKAGLKPQRVFVLGQPGGKQKALESDSDFASKVLIQEAVNQVRRIKDAAEIAKIEEAAVMASKGYALLKNLIRPGVSERQIQIEYEAEVLRAGSEKFPYGTIVGAGTNAAVLHAIPTAKVVRAGEMVLVDAGADVQDYCVDITRVFAADGEFSSRQKDIYQLVLKAQLKGIELCVPGSPWVDVHRVAARTMAEGLKDLGLMKGSVDSLLETGAISVFFPHGVGHMVGLKVRDVGGLSNQPPAQSCGARLRVNLNLQENFVMTVEPGLYFVAALLGDPQVRAKYKDQIEWTRVEDWKDFGGVRIEDDILVTFKGPRNLTALVPK